VRRVAKERDAAVGPAEGWDVVVDVAALDGTRRCGGNDVADVLAPVAVVVEQGIALISFVILAGLDEPEAIPLGLAVANVAAHKVLLVAEVNAITDALVFRGFVVAGGSVARVAAICGGLSVILHGFADAGVNAVTADEDVSGLFGAVGELGVHAVRSVAVANDLALLLNNAIREGVA
jgi:hypothetical protein